jgi:MFS family permease
VLPVRNQAPLPFRPPFFYGWAIVGISALGVFFSGPGQTYSVSAFVDPLIEHFGWSRSLVSGLYSLGTLCAGLALTGMGRLVDRHGHRTMMPIVAAAFGLACIFMSAILNPAMLLVGFGLIRFLGQGSMTLVSNTLVPQWFRFKRGRAMSLVALGSAISTASVPKINTWIIDVWGWRVAWQVWAILLILAIAPLFRLLVRNRPEDIGLLPDNIELPAPGADGAPPDEESWTLAEAMRTRTFWLLISCIGVPSMINTGLIFHQVSILGARGLSPAVSATVFSVAVLVHLPVNFLAGYLLDRIPPRMALAGIYVGHLILMAWILRTDSIGMAIGMGVLRGIVGGFEGITSGVLWPSYFGRRHIGSIGGASMTVMVIGSAMGPLPFGVAFDMFGGYSQIILLMMAFPVFGIVAALLATPPKKPI